MTTPAQIEALRGNGGPLLVEFGSTACAGCRDMKPVIAEVASTLAGQARVADADVLVHRSLMAPYGIRMIPTQIVFDHRGTEVARLHGVQDATRLTALLEQARAR